MHSPAGDGVASRRRCRSNDSCGPIASRRTGSRTRAPCMSQRFSQLTQITPDNVKNLELQWIFQARSIEKFETTALVVDGIMYTVQAPNDLLALDAVTGRTFWMYSYRPVPGLAALLRPGQSRRRDPWRHAVHGDDRRPPGRRRRQERPADLGRRGGETRSRLRVDARPAGRQGQSHRRHGRRRVRHPRLSRGLRREDRARKSGASTPFPGPARPATRPGPATRGSAAAARSG